MTPTAAAPPHTTWWDWILANAPGISAVAAATGASAAIVAAIIAVRSLVRAARDSRDRSRPVMIAQLGLHPDSELYFQLTIKNVGLSLARNLRVTFDPELPTTQTDGWLSGVYFHRMFENPLETFGPGQELSNPWCAYNETGVPDSCTVSFSYEDAHGRKYPDHFVIDIRPYKALLTISSDDSVKGRLKALVGEAKSQTREARAQTREARSQVEAQWALVRHLRDENADGSGAGKSEIEASGVGDVDAPGVGDAMPDASPTTIDSLWKYIASGGLVNKRPGRRDGP